jgi:hypothetical protein
MQGIMAQALNRKEEKVNILAQILSKRFIGASAKPKRTVEEEKDCAQVKIPKVMYEVHPKS